MNNRKWKGKIKFLKTVHEVNVINKNINCYWLLVLGIHVNSLPCFFFFKYIIQDPLRFHWHIVPFHYKIYTAKKSNFKIINLLRVLKALTHFCVCKEHLVSQKIISACQNETLWKSTFGFRLTFSGIEAQKSLEMTCKSFKEVPKNQLFSLNF
jgi:hypothetical protein